MTLVTLFLFFSTLGGGYGLIYLTGNGFFKKWAQLPAPPEKIIHIYFPAQSVALAGKTKDGTIYLCCWSKRPDLEAESKYSDGSDQNLKPPPYPSSKVEEHVVSIRTLAIGGSYREDFILFNDGSIWKWEHRTGNPDAYDLVIPLFGIIFGTLGVAIGILITGMLITRHLQNTKTK